ncbi:MAG: hypothetical protein K5829_00460 [Treponema sp.]|nr:hypothetical protein [Treponema sp.]
MTRLLPGKSFFILFLILLLSFNLHAEIISDEDFGFSLDIPEGFNIEDYSEDGMSYLFSHPNIPVHFLMKIVEGKNISSVKEALSQNLEKLTTEKNIDLFKWNESECAISLFNMTLDSSYSCWATSCQLPAAKNYYLFLMCYAPKEQMQGCNQFIMSLLNSLCIDQKYYNRPGIIVSYAYSDEGKKRIQLNVAGTKVNTSIDKIAEEASKFEIDSEFAVFKLYASHPLWKEAWQRYYRLIYRDNYGRIEDCLNDILTRLLEEAEALGCEDKNLYAAQKLLSWVQDFSYTRKNTSAEESDFTSLAAAICGEGNDCDCRSMLICACMRSLGVESVLLISREYSHAMAAVKLDAPGQTYIPEGSDIELLMGETTAKVTWGMIAQDMADRSKWIPVYLP